MIAIIDYGMGNVRSVQKAFESQGYVAHITRSHQVICDARHVVLPGVGAFGDCMANLERFDLIEPIQKAIQCGKPFLGICLGLQVLFNESDEFGFHKGLGIIPGKVRRFPFGHGTENVHPGQASVSMASLKVPHMGWNAIRINRRTPLFSGVASGAFLYFVHSYYVDPEDPTIVCTITDYGIPFASSIHRDNLFACQFHPEKSQTVGLNVIRNFAQWT